MAENNGQGAGAGEGAGNGAGAGQGDGKGAAGAGVQVPVTNADGTVTIGDKVFISKESYEVVAAKQRETSKKIEAFEKEKADAEKKRLEEQGEFKTLAEKAQAEAATLKETYTKREKANALKIAAMQAGTVDADAVAALASLDAIKVSEDGTVDAASVKDVVDTLKKEKPYLFAAAGQGGKPAVGNSGGSPAQGDGSGAPQKFKRSQLSDSKFYQANREAILAAAARGDIEDDVNA